MFGLATLQMAQSLRTHISSVRLGGPGLQIPDASSSCASYSASDSAVTTTRTRTRNSSSGSNGNGSSIGGNPSGSGSGSGNGSGSGQGLPPAEVPTGKRQNAAEHTFAWRDFLDIIVRWRQVRLLSLCDIPVILHSSLFILHSSLFILAFFSVSSSFFSSVIVTVTAAVAQCRTIFVRATNAPLLFFFSLPPLISSSLLSSSLLYSPHYKLSFRCLIFLRKFPLLTFNAFCYS